MTAKTLKGMRIKKINYLETSRGVAYTAPMLLDEKEIGSIENNGEGGPTDIRVYGESRQELQERMNAYFKENNIEFLGTKEEEFAEHLIDLYEYGKVLTEDEKFELLK